MIIQAKSVDGGGDAAPKGSRTAPACSVSRRVHQLRRLLGERVAPLGALDCGVRRREHARRIVLPEPDVQVVVVETLGLQGHVPLHRSLKLLAKNRGTSSAGYLGRH